ncbi:hypothetical protein BGX27_001668 [Mortierella sp. AM989]|nr:hypothetical protein BGX27_001668 [Mortierella sp. AM989]
MERRVTRRSIAITSTESTAVVSAMSSKTRGRGRGRGRLRGSNRGQGHPLKNLHEIEDDSNAQDEQKHDEEQEQEQEGEREISRNLMDNMDGNGHSQSHDAKSDTETVVNDSMEVNDRGSHDYGSSSIVEAIEKTSDIPLIPPTSPPTSTQKDRLSLLEPDTPHMIQTTNMVATATPTSASVSGPKNLAFFSEDLYNRISVSGTRRLSELFKYKKRGIDTQGASKPESSSEDTTDKAAEGSQNVKKQRVSKPLAVQAQSRDVKFSDGNSSDSTHAISSGVKFNISDLVASVTSYVPEITSALHADHQQQQQQQQNSSQQHQQHQQQAPSIIQMKSTDNKFYHPCIYSHNHRSALTREEHRRYIMYDAIARGLHKDEFKPQLGPEDRALWATLQEKVDQERLSVRQWQAEVVRSRVTSYFNPAIQAAMEAKFIKARARVHEEYPQHYEFVQSVGLRLPGVHSTANSAKEPTLNRKKADVIKSGTPDSPKSVQTKEPDPRGLLKRTGKICPVSLANPTWPTDEDGVPYENYIKVDDRYWSTPETSSSSIEPQSSGKKIRMSDQDYRRTHFPSKTPALSITKDPTVKQFIKEQNVQAAFAASSLVALAKTLPSLSSEWEIPVRVVLEEDHEGVMQKRIYVDKPLIRKKMSAMEMTQSFYDGVLKKLSLVGFSSTDTNVLTLSPQDSISEPIYVPPKDPSDGGSAFESLGSLKETNDMVNIESVGKTLNAVLNEEELTSSEKEKASGTQNINEEEEGILGSRSTLQVSEERNDGFEYSLWTFGETRILIRSRIHGYLDQSEPFRQVVLRSILDYAPDIGIGEPSKGTMAGWWMAAWIRDDRLVALGRVDVSKNQFVRYPDPKSSVIINPDPNNPFGGVFSDLPAISILDANALRAQDRGDWIKPNMRLIHYILGKLLPLGPGQYILGHKRHDINANIYKAVQESEELASSKKGHYDLHAAHKSSPQLFNDNSTESAGSGGGVGGGDGGLADDDLHLQWFGTPDQIPGTFPYDEHERTTKPRGQRGGRGKKKGKRGQTK